VRQRWVLGGRGVTDGGGAPVGVWAAADVGRDLAAGRVCGPGEDDVDGRAREDGGRVRTARARGSGKSGRRQQLDLAAGVQTHVLG
jgi:hypothetical protein